MSAEKQLKSQIKSNIEKDSNGCWIWQKSIGRDEYGSFVTRYVPFDIRKWLDDHGIPNRHAVQTHKLSHVLFNGSLPEETPLVLHKCGNKLCCNPKHLYAGTHKDNARDEIVSGRKRLKTKYKKRPPEVIADIKSRIIDGQSFYSIARRYGMYVSSVRSHAVRLQKKGILLPQFKNC